MNKLDADKLGRTRTKRIIICVYLCLSVVSLLTACQSLVTPTPTATLVPMMVEGGVVDTRLNDKSIVLDRRAEPFTTLKLSDTIEMIGSDKQPISLLDLRDGDFVRAEGIPSADSFIVNKLTLVLRAARAIPSPTASVTPSGLASPTITPIIPFGDKIQLPGTVLIADSGNHRLLQVTQDKKIVWEFPGSASMENFSAPSDVTFAPNGKTLIVTHSHEHQVTEVDYAARKIVWRFGEWGVPGSDDLHLNSPRSAYRLPDGRTVIADTRNCRILIVTLDKKIAGQIARADSCKGDGSSRTRMSGLISLPNANMLVTETGSRRVSELDVRGKAIRSVSVPLNYASDAQLTRAGNVLATVYDKPGRIIEMNWQAQVTWEFFPRVETEQLNRPSSAIELPNGNIVFTDDWNHRVVIVNRSGKIVWQYGVMNVAGKSAGYLNAPSGIDFRAIPIPEATITAIASITPSSTPTPRVTPTK